MLLVFLLSELEPSFHSVQNRSFFLLTRHPISNEVFHCFVIDILLRTELIFLILEEGKIIVRGSRTAWTRVPSGQWRLSFGMRRCNITMWNLTDSLKFFASGNFLFFIDQFYLGLVDLLMQLKDPFITTLPHTHLLNPMQTITVPHTRRRNHHPLIHRVPCISRRHCMVWATFTIVIRKIWGMLFIFDRICLTSFNTVERRKIIITQTNAVFISNTRRSLQALVGHDPGSLTSGMSFTGLSLLLDKAIHSAFS